MRWFIYILLLCSFKTVLAVDNGGIENPSNVYLISIGINNYTEPFWQLNYCVNDALYLEESLKSFNIEKSNSLTSQTKSLNKLKTIRKHNIKSIIPYVLANEEATLENIRNAFKDVISKATYNDYFVFLFSGLSAESKEDNTYLIPYSSSYSIEYEHNRVGNKMSRFNENEFDD